MEVLMFGIFKKSKVVRKSEDKYSSTETKRYNGQKVKIKSGTSRSRNRKEDYKKANRQTWFRETPLPVPFVDRKQMLISFKGGSSKIAILEGATLVEYYTAEAKSKSLVGNIYLGKVKNILPGMEAAFVSIGEEKNVSYTLQMFQILDAILKLKIYLNKNRKFWFRLLKTQWEKKVQD